MNLIENIPLEIDFSRLSLALGSSHRFPLIREKAQWAKETVEKTAQPKIILRTFPIKNRDGDTVTVSSENGSRSTVLEVGTKGVELLADAEVAQISFVTLGDKLHSLENSLKTQGEMMKQYLLDTAAVMALYHVGQTVNQMAEQTAAENGWGVGRRMSPGTLDGWALPGQSALKELLSVQKIGIQIHPSGLLKPLRSASGLVGMGSSYKSDHVGTICHWCQNQKTCPIRLSERKTCPEETDLKRIR